MSDWKNVQYKDGKMRTSEGGGGGGSSTFAGLDDVSFSNLQNGQIPKYNSTTHKWENANESGGGGTVTDVTVDGTSVVNQQGVAEIETPDADAIDYDNQQSGLSATDVQSAIDELAQGSGGGGNVDDVEVNGVSVVDAQKVAKITSYKEVTLAEYQALPNSKLSDNVLYCIKDTGGADGFPPLIYSDEEREVGVWRDGKPLYQKTINIGALVNSNNWQRISHGINNIDKIIDVRAIAHVDDSTMDFLPIPNYRAGYSYGVSFGVNETQISYINNWITGDSYTYVTLQYTKTTDTAGSGTWTMQGGYAHHYSTTEQVIGTWIDGKPLYEITVQGNVAAQTGYINLFTLASGITIQRIDGYVRRTGDINIPSGSLGFYVYSQGSYVNCYNSEQGNSGQPFTVIVQYTKTTD